MSAIEIGEIIEVIRAQFAGPDIYIPATILSKGPTSFTVKAFRPKDHFGKHREDLLALRYEDANRSWRRT